MSFRSYLHFAATLVVLAVVSGCQTPVREADRWNALFVRRNGYGWSGGDGGYTISLPAGRTLWLFGDSVLSRAEGDRRMDLEPRFGNTIAIQRTPPAGDDPLGPDSMRFDWGPPGSNGWLPIFDETLTSAAIPESLKRARQEARPVLAWPLHGIVIKNDLLLFNSIVTPANSPSAGMFNFEVHGSTLSVIDRVDRAYDDWGVRSDVGWQSRPRQQFVEPGRALGPSGLWLLWGTFVVADPADPTGLFVYGHRNQSGSSDLVVARVSGIDRALDALDFRRWSYWDGQSWASRPETAKGILDRAAAEASIVRIPEASGSGWAVVHTGIGVENALHVALSPNPTGPFLERYEFRLADCPIQGFDPKRHLAYAVKAHPDLSSDDELLVSVVLVSIQAGAAGQPEEHTGYYVPRFLRLPWQEILRHSRSAPERCEQPS